MTEIKKKRGRKPKNVEKKENIINENKDNIIHLRINNLDNSVNYYDNKEQYYEYKNLNKEKDENYIYNIKSYPYNNIISNNNSKNIHCFWCCHNFDSTVYTLPTKIENDVYNVYGCFCSPECACAYNFNDYKERNKIWERYSLLNLLYKKLLDDKNLEITSALPREMLNIFGGTYTIEEFRKYNKNYKKEIKLFNYPLVSNEYIKNEIDIYNNIIKKNNNKDYIPLNYNNIENIHNDELKLKRSKPLNTNKNTLENCMNLKYN